MSLKLLFLLPEKLSWNAGAIIIGKNEPIIQEKETNRERSFGVF